MSNLTGKVSIYQRISDDKVTYRHVSKYDERLNPLEYNTINYSKTTHRDTIYQATNQVKSLLEKGDSTTIDRFITGQEFDNLVLEEKYFAIDPTLFPTPEKERIDGTRRHTTNSRLYVVSGFDWDLLKSGKEFADENLATFKRLYPTLGKTEVNLFGYNVASNSYVDVPSPLSRTISNNYTIESLFASDEIKERYKCEGIVSLVNYKEPDSNDYTMWSGISFNLPVPGAEDANKELILFEVQQTKLITNTINDGNKEFVTRAFRIIFDDGRPFRFADLPALPESLYSADDYKVLIAEEPDLFYIVNIFFNNKIAFDTIETDDYSLELVYHNTLKDKLFPDGVARSESLISTVTNATIQPRYLRISASGNENVVMAKKPHTGKLESHILSTRSDYMPLIGLLDNITDENRHIALLFYPSIQEDLAENGKIKRYSLMYPDTTEQDKLKNNPLESLAPQSFVRNDASGEDIQLVYIDDSNTSNGHVPGVIYPRGFIFPVEYVSTTYMGTQGFLNDISSSNGVYEYNINRTDIVNSSYGIGIKLPTNFVTQVVDYESSAESIDVTTTLEGNNTLKYEVEYVFRSPIVNDIYLIPLPFQGRLFYLNYKTPLKVAASQTIIIKVNFYERFF